MSHSACQFPWEQVTKKGSKSSQPASEPTSAGTYMGKAIVMVVFQLLYVASNWAIRHSRWRWAIGNPSHCAVYQSTMLFHAKVLWLSWLGHGIYSVVVILHTWASRYIDILAFTFVATAKCYRPLAWPWCAARASGCLSFKSCAWGLFNCLLKVPAWGRHVSKISRQAFTYGMCNTSPSFRIYMPYIVGVCSDRASSLSGAHGCQGVQPW